MNKDRETALIIGAGPAGLTAALELLERSDVVPLVLERSEYMGGISRTVRYKGNRIDIGGHRFFSKSDRVMNWWLRIMPPEASDATEQQITYQNRQRLVRTGDAAPHRDSTDRVMLIRQRKSRIYFCRKFFDYPIRLSADTLRKLGIARTCRIGLSYARSMMRQIKPERNLEQFFINRFGRELYRTFFKSYTEKVWGVPCSQISAEWGAQRIKGLSIRSALAHFFKSLLQGSKRDIAQKGTETSLIEKFLYPKLGPGQLWEYVAEQVVAQGGTVATGWTVQRLHVRGDRLTGVDAVHHPTGEHRRFEADYFFSTMPVRELVESLQTDVPAAVKEVAAGLVYRDFITVGLLLKDLSINSESVHGSRLLKDNWIYIQEPDVLAGRLQIFNNWSPYLVKDPTTVWIGVEYFCYESDDLWKKPDAELIEFAVAEMEKIGILRRGDVIDGVAIRVAKSYPAYFGAYERFGEIREYLDGFRNLFLIGRNGMHKYNNQDHSMLTAMTAVDNIIAGRVDKSNIWAVNTENEYHEEKHAEKPAASSTAAAPV